MCIDQDSNSKNTTRSLSSIITPGTYIDDNINVFQSNNITSLWIEHIKNNLHVGISNINIITVIHTFFNMRLNLQNFQICMISLKNILLSIIR